MPVDRSKKTDVALLRRWRESPCAFVWDTMGVDPTKQQAEILQATGVPGAWVTVRSGHRIGKSAAVAWLILHGLTCYDDIKIPCTANTGDQLREREEGRELRYSQDSPERES